jgi:predicted ArsR family transcriptional regulator
MRLTTQLRIMNFLRKQGSATVHELSRAFRLSGANIRHHLAVMKSNDLIESISQQRQGKGRPVWVYGLSQRVLGDGLDNLVRAIFDALFRTKSDEDREAYLKSVAVSLGGKNPSRTELLQPAHLNRVIDRLNELHYQARWEAGLDGPHVILGHCPYATIIATYPELCRMDALLLLQHIGLPVEQTAKLQPSAKGHPFCSFLVSHV